MWATLNNTILMKPLYWHYFQSDVDYIYFTGDIISHRIWDTTKRNNTVYLREIYAKLREVFSNKPLYPIIGNHESHPTNV